MKTAGRILLMVGMMMFGAQMEAASNEKSRTAPLVQKVQAIGITVSDMDLSLGFYTRLLNFEKVEDIEVLGEEYDNLLGLFGVRVRLVKLKLGDQFLWLTEYLTPRGRPIPIDSRSHDHWFQQISIVVSDMKKAYKLLHDNDIQHISSSPQTLAGGIQAFFFEDPDGHPLELIYFPSERSEERWRKGGKGLFLGIDHTTIVVKDTETSLKFYRDLLGFEVAGQRDHEGSDLARLVGLRDAKIRETLLEAPAGPGIVLAEYLHPDQGRPMPQDTLSNDLWNWQIHLQVGDVAQTEDAIRKRGYYFVSTGIPFIQKAVLGFQRGFIADDPDGHALLFMER